MRRVSRRNSSWSSKIIVTPRSGAEIKTGSTKSRKVTVTSRPGSQRGNNSSSNRRVCNYCGDLVTSEDLLTHEKQHFGGGGGGAGAILKCLLCPQTFRFDYLLKLHNRTRHRDMENLKSGTLNKPEEQPEGEGVKVKRSTRSQSTIVKESKISENLSRSDSALANKGRGRPRKILLTAPKSRGRPRIFEPNLTSKAVTSACLKDEEIKDDPHELDLSIVKCAPEETWDAQVDVQLQDVSVKQEQEPPESGTPFHVVARKSAPPTFDLTIEQVKIKEEPEQVDNLQCKYCPTRSCSRRSLEMHYLRVHTSHDKKPFHCTVPGCGKGFATSAEHRRHEITCQRKSSMRNEKIKNDPVSGDDEYFDLDSVKGQGDYDYADDMTSRKVCPHCPNPRKFPTNSAVLAHIWRTHVSYDQRPFQCNGDPTCQRRYGTMTELNVHIRRKHPNAQPLRGQNQMAMVSIKESPVTGKCIRRRSLKMKRVTFQNTRTMKKLGGSGGRGLQRGRLPMINKIKKEMIKVEMKKAKVKRVARRLTGKRKVTTRADTRTRPNECLFCGFRFRHYTHLEQHMNKHTLEKPFECGHCDSWFAYRCDAWLHRKRHHGGAKPTGKRPQFYFLGDDNHHQQQLQVPEARPRPSEESLEIPVDDDLDLGIDGESQDSGGDKSRNDADELELEPQVPIEPARPWLCSEQEMKEFFRVDMNIRLGIVPQNEVTVSGTELQLHQPQPEDISTNGVEVVREIDVFESVDALREELDPENNFLLKDRDLEYVEMGGGMGRERVVATPINGNIVNYNYYNDNDEDEDDYGFEGRASYAPIFQDGRSADAVEPSKEDLEFLEVRRTELMEMEISNKDDETLKVTWKKK